MPKRTNLQRKADRLNRRAGRIEKRKGLGKGEGAKVLANRKQRRKELWQAPREGQEGFTKKYMPTPAEDAKQFGIETNASAIKDKLEPDRTDMSSNVMSAFYRKKGY